MGEVGPEVALWVFKRQNRHKCADLTLSLTSHPRWRVQETPGFKASRNLPTEYEDIGGGNPSETRMLQLHHLKGM